MVGSATVRRVPTGSPRCRARSRSRVTCRPTASCGGQRCARHIPTRGSCESTSHRRWNIDGVAAVITADDVPGKPTYGLISSDQPVFARDVVRYVGEPIAAVAADHPETCRRALEAIVVEYEVLDPLTDPERAIDGSHPPIHPYGNVIRHQRIVQRRPVARSATWSSRARTRSACRIRRSWAWRPRWRCPIPGGRRRPVRRDPVAARGSCPDRRLPRSRPGEGPPDARGSRRRVRCTRRHQPAGAHLLAGAAHRPPGAYGLQPRRRAFSDTSTGIRPRSGCVITPRRRV